MRKVRNQRGEFSLLAALAAALGITVFALIAAIAAGDIGRQGGDSGPLVNPNIAGGLPCEQVANYAREKWKLYMTGRGFRSLEPDLAEPQRSAFRSDADFIAAYASWRGAMAATVSGVMSDLQAECELRRGRVDLPVPKPEPPPAAENFSGRYPLETQGGDCRGGLPPAAAIVVQHSGSKVAVTFEGNGRRMSLGSGSMDSDNRWSVRVENEGRLIDGFLGDPNAQSSADKITIELSGQFVASGDDKLLRSGLLRFTWEGTCTTSFTGIRDRT